MALDDGLQAEKETDVNDSVGEPVDMSKALSEGECERELQQSFQNVLRQCLEKNQAIIGHVQNLIDQLMLTPALIEVRRKWNPNGV